MKTKGEDTGQEENCSTDHPICSSPSWAHLTRRDLMLKSILLGTLSRVPLPSSSPSVPPSQRAQKKKKSNSKNPSYEAGSVTPFDHSCSHMSTSGQRQFKTHRAPEMAPARHEKHLSSHKQRSIWEKQGCAGIQWLWGPALLLHFV